ALPGCEFPANVYPFLNLRRKGVEIDFIPHRESTLSLEDVERALTPQTRLLSLSWVQFLSGFRTDLKAVGRLCRERGVIFCIDAIQGLGALRIDVQACGIDFLACGAQKWLMATQGIGFLYLSARLQERLAPAAAGWLHGPVDWDNFFDYELAFHPDASRFRLGTLNDVGIAALHAALGVYREAGPEWCERQVLARVAELARGLEGLGLERYGTPDPAHASGIVTVKHPQADAVQAFLQERGITTCVRNRMLRFSPTYYNTPEEIQKTLAAIAAFQDEAVVVSGGTAAETTP
ncbi:MAG TPA: aminotransferase class V-fold PLP-dependent enzyme, partial [Rhodothermales bacterium]|nr:aminotransferase class V-fold PLP-dependent enzyme [Rhodothermales bacterium]